MQTCDQHYDQRTKRRWTRALEKLVQAKLLEAIGMHQTAMCKTLGVSVMTPHRWRYERPASGPVQALQLENDRLRQAVVDLLLGTAELKGSKISEFKRLD